MPVSLPSVPIPDVPVLVLSGPSGTGKTTVVSRLLVESPVKLVKSVSATTRPPRIGEIHGQDYYFLSADEFEQLRRQGRFLECAEVHKSGFWYGTLISELQRAIDEGAWTLLEIDVEGALSVMQRYPRAVTVFLSTPSEEYERRLRARGTETEAGIERRLQTARQELTFADRYQYQVVNADLDQAVTEICEILTSIEAQRHAG
jgi:guanylate kinase